jgi:hypothetical protein
MTRLMERDLSVAPLDAADGLLRAFFATHPSPQGIGSRIVLRAGMAALPAIVTTERVQGPSEPSPRYSIHWEAEGGPYPEFDGELIIATAHSGFWLVLIGVYVPPGGIAGQAFDMTVGRLIARSTARNLLRNMRVEIEALARGIAA